MSNPPPVPPQVPQAGWSPASFSRWDGRTQALGKNQTPLTAEQAAAVAAIRTHHYVKQIFIIAVIWFIMSLLGALLIVAAAADSSNASSDSTDVCIQYPSLC